MRMPTRASEMARAFIMNFPFTFLEKYAPRKAPGITPKIRAATILEFLDHCSSLQNNVL